MRYKPTIQIDLDGVLNTYRGDYDENFIPPIKEGAKDFLEKMYAKYKLVLFSTRNTEMAAKWLQDNGIQEYFSDVTNVKTSAYITVDDRCVCFRGNYDSLICEIDNFKVWYK